MLAQQVEDIARGRPPSNAVAVKRLSASEREHLRAAFEAVGTLDEVTRDLLF
jgi:CBS domain-containing protein